MFGFSIWHFVIMSVLLALPVLVFAAVWLAMRADRRAQASRNAAGAAAAAARGIGGSAAARARGLARARPDRSGRVRTPAPADPRRGVSAPGGGARAQSSPLASTHTRISPSPRLAQAK